jgi:hypothetical protein
MIEEFYRKKYPGIWMPELEVFRVLTIPEGTGYIDVSFINDHSIRLGITPAATPGIYKDVWLFTDFETTLAAAYTWAASGLDDELYGWYRHPASGRRRHNGNHLQEYYQP